MKHRTPWGEEARYYTDDVWEDLMGTCGVDSMVQGWAADGGREHYITAESVRKTFGLDALLEGIYRHDFQIHWARIGEYHEPWIPLSGFVVYRAISGARKQK